MLPELSRIDFRNSWTPSLERHHILFIKCYLKHLEISSTLKYLDTKLDNSPFILLIKCYLNYFGILMVMSSSSSKYLSSNFENSLHTTH